MSIYITTHKRTQKYGDDNYKLLHVGAILTDDRFGKEYLLDSEGNNISNKNKSFCELTGLYWLWKSAPRQGMSKSRKLVLPHKVS